MFKEGFQLTSNAQLDAAIMNRSEIMIWQQGQYLSHGGVIEGYNDDVVRIDGYYYIRGHCIFKIRKKRKMRGSDPTKLIQ